jgi:hypothetical protein
MRSRSIVSPEDQKVTFVELFFDLVFVFSVTQVVSVLHDGMDATAVGQAVLVFWLVWWGWTQFTWAGLARSRFLPAARGRCRRNRQGTRSFALNATTRPAAHGGRA